MITLKLTRAFPKIANYPFTTLRPYIGTARFIDNSQIRFADLPGLIEGASENKGLGHQFLKHAERTKTLLYVIDGLSNLEGRDRDPLSDYRVLRRELRKYDPKFLDRPSLIAFNKCDKESEGLYEQQLELLKREAHTKVIPISAMEGTNLELLLDSIKVIIDK